MNEPRLKLMIAAVCLAAGGCDEMVSQPKQTAYGPLAPSAEPAGVVEYGYKPLEAPPLTLALLEPGRERYSIFCAPCHAELGDGRGMIVQRGFPRPASFHDPRLREATPKYLYDVITSGYGVMYSFGDRVSPDDRWAIAAYIRALQRSQNPPPEAAVAIPAGVPAPTAGQAKLPAAP